jgi:hypothetical protein
MLMFAVLARERRRLFRFLVLPLLFSVLAAHGSVASAATLNVKIRQLNPDGADQQVTCAEKQKCELPIDIQTGSTKQSLTVSILFATPRMLIRFQTPKANLYAGETTPDNKHFYDAFWPRTLSQGKTSTENVTLYSLAGPTPIIAPILDADREAGLKITHSAVATLEVTTQTVP